MKREVHQFEYVCDGATLTGRKCVRTVLMTAYDNNDADYRVSQTESPFTRLTWSFTHLGWLCPEPHRDDPRRRFKPEVQP